MMIERDRAVQFGQRNFQRSRNVANDLGAQPAVTIVKSMKNRKQRSRFLPPLIDDRLITRRRIHRFKKGEAAS